MVPYLDAMLSQAMPQYLDNFFLALQGDGSSLSSFLGTLSSFSDTIRTHRGRLQDDTLVAAHNLATVINVIAQNLLDLDKTTAQLRDESAADLSKILGDEMGKLVISDNEKERRVKSEKIEAFPAYLKPSYEWLLVNLHNPYPAKEFKRKLARQSNCSIRDIDTWFIDIRKRIGWNKLRKTHFSNKQEKIIAAAIRYFQPSMSTINDALDESEIRDPTEIYDFEFEAIRDCAETLYRAMFPETIINSYKSFNLASTSVVGKSNDPPNRFRRSVSVDIPNYVYPTPESSPAHTAGPSPPPSPVSHSTPNMYQVSSLKRRRSVFYPEDASFHKRPRMDSTIEILCSLPSPSSSVDHSDGDTEVATPPTSTSSISEDVLTTRTDLTHKRKRSSSEDTSQEGSLKSFDAVLVPNNSDIVPFPNTDQTPSKKRKRRLSGVDTDRFSKHFRNAFALPRLQTVSDPYPIAKSHRELSSDDWVTDILEAAYITDSIPTPLDLNVANALESGPLDLHLHQYDFALSETPDFEDLQHSPALLLDPTNNTNTEDLVTQFTYDPDNTYKIENFDFDFVPLALSKGSLDFLTSTIISDIPYNSTPCHEEPLPCSDFNIQLQHSLPTGGDQDAKRARAQALREELRRLEGELQI